jgi:hypothetical protein
MANPILPMAVSGDPNGIRTHLAHFATLRDSAANAWQNGPYLQKNKMAS